MKKTISLALTLILALSLAACGGKDNGGGTTEGNNDPLSRESTSAPSTTTPSGGDTAPDVDMSAILSGNGGGALVSSFDEATKQAFIAEAKADGYDVTFGADGSMTMTDTATGDKIVQKPDGSWSVAEGNGGLTVNVGGDWPDNEFTKLIPKPDFDIVSANVVGTQFVTMFNNVKLDDMKAYVEQVKAKGFTVNATTNDQEAAGMVIYTYAADNADGWNVGITVIADGQYTMSVTKP